MPYRIHDLGHPYIRRWRGVPNCDGTHAFILEQLRAIGCAFLAPAQVLSLIQVGNLGEFIAYCVGQRKTFVGYDAYPANADRPLNTISNDGIDIIWFRFAPDPANDSIFLQEVKTTAGMNLDIHYSLIGD